MTKQNKPWQDRLKALIERVRDKQTAYLLWQKYVGLFPADYQTLISPR